MGAHPSTEHRLPGSGTSWVAPPEGPDEFGWFGSGPGGGSGLPAAWWLGERDPDETPHADVTEHDWARDLEEDPLEADPDQDPTYFVHG